MTMAKGPAVSVRGTGWAGLSGGGPGPVNGGTMPVDVPVDRPTARAVTVPAAGLPPEPGRLGRLSRPNAGRNSRAAGKPGRLSG
jgi:hypothetical protein